MTINQPTLKSFFATNTPDKMFINGNEVPQQYMQFAMRVIARCPLAVKSIVKVRRSSRAVKVCISTYTSEEVRDFSIKSYKVTRQCQMTDLLVFMITDRMVEALRQIADALNSIARAFSILLPKSDDTEEDNGGKQ
ncbi:MAG: hypothetical protein HDT32_04910 [Clostridiales bacterium]|nr:hypothetical protein [Clostridiales bacterium]